MRITVNSATHNFPNWPQFPILSGHPQSSKVASFRFRPLVAIYSLRILTIFRSVCIHNCY